jgi:hypothetical protein
VYIDLENKPLDLEALRAKLMLGYLAGSDPRGDSDGGLDSSRTSAITRHRRNAACAKNA